MKFTKRALVLLLALCMVTSMMPQPTYAAERPAATSASTTKAAKLKTPALPKLSNVNGGIKISWSKVKSAAKYRIFYKTGNGKWKKLADTTKTSYTWKKAKSGTKYSFTIRCVTKNGKSYTSGYNKKGKAITYIAAPKLKTVQNTGKGIKVAWGKVKGAAKYRIFYKTGNGKWKKLADTTKTSYTWKKAKNGTTYSFTVRCITKNGKKYTSAYNTKGLKIKCVLAKADDEFVFIEPEKTPENKTENNPENNPENKTDTTEQVAKPKLATPELYSATTISNTKVKVTWGAVKGASKYRVYYKTGNGDWTKAGDTTGTSYEVIGLKAGTTYVFTVKCLATDSAEASGYNKYGMMAETTGADTTETDTTEEGTSGGSTQPTEPTHPTQEETEAEKKAKEQAAKWKAAWTNLYNLCGSVSDWTGGYGSESFLLLDDDVFNRLQKARAVGGDLQFNWRNRTTGTDAEIAEMDAAAKELQAAWDLAKKPESRAKFDPSKLVYCETASKQLHEKWNEQRIKEGYPTIEWSDICSDVAKVQATYNLLVSSHVLQNQRDEGWGPECHWYSMNGTGYPGGVAESVSVYVDSVFNAFYNSPPHRGNHLRANAMWRNDDGTYMSSYDPRWGGTKVYEGIALMQYEFHGCKNALCIVYWGADDPDCGLEWAVKGKVSYRAGEEIVDEGKGYYAHNSKIRLEDIPGVTEDGIIQTLKHVKTK